MLKVPKGDKLCCFSFFIFAVNSADCGSCKDSFKRRGIKSDGRGRAVQQLGVTMILSTSSREKTDNESSGAAVSFISVASLSYTHTGLRGCK